MLENKKIAIFIEDMFNVFEFWYPYYRFKEAGAEVLVAGPATGVVHGGERGLPAEVSHPVEELEEDQIDLLYLPGGLRASQMPSVAIMMI